MLSAFQISRLTSRADGGELPAQRELAEIYRWGRGVNANIGKAIQYYSLAARQNDPDALFFIAECQDLGRGMSANLENAFQNYLRAAKLGHADAMVCAAYFYEMGRGTYQNKDLARQYYQAAAAKGHPDAAKKLQALDSGQGAASQESPLERVRAEQRLRDNSREKLITLRKLALEAVARCEDLGQLETIIKALR